MSGLIIDNFAGAGGASVGIEDALQEAGIYKRDSQIKRLAVHMKDEVRKGGQVLVQISEAA